SRHPNPGRQGWQSPRDLVGELAEAVRDAGMRMGLYYSGGIDWTFGGLPIRSVGDVIRALPTGDDYARYADAHWRELIERYQPSLLWNAIAYPTDRAYPSLFDDYYRAVPDRVVTDRFDI